MGGSWLVMIQARHYNCRDEGPQVAMRRELTSFVVYFTVKTYPK